MLKGRKNVKLNIFEYLKFKKEAELEMKVDWFRVSFVFDAIKFSDIMITDHFHGGIWDKFAGISGATKNFKLSMS